MDQGDLHQEEDNKVAVIHQEEDDVNKESSPLHDDEKYYGQNEEEEPEDNLEDDDQYLTGSEDDDYSDGSWIDEDSVNVLKRNFALTRQLNRIVDDQSLPKSVTILHGTNGSKIYLIGTAHFSTESCEEVEKLVEEVQPDAIMLELCRARSGLLQMDEKTLAEKSVESAWNKVGDNIREKGVMAGFMTVLMTQLSIHITKQLGVAPGGEFRSAFFTAKKVPGCVLLLGDRDISVTLKRAFGKLSFYGKLKFCFNMCKDFNFTISKEDVEKLKDKDMLEQLFDELMDAHKEIYDVFCKERDVYLSYSIQKAASSMIELSEEDVVPSVIVAVVGMGHCKGIIENFDREITMAEMKEISKIPEKSKISWLFSSTVKLSILSAVIYGVYSVGKLGVSYLY